MTVSGETLNAVTNPTLCSPVGNSGPVGWSGASPAMAFFTHNAAGGAIDGYFSFAIYKPVFNAAYPPVPKHPFQDDMEWSMKRPREFAAFRAACLKAEQVARAASETEPGPGPAWSTRTTARVSSCFGPD